MIFVVRHAEEVIKFVIYFLQKNDQICRIINKKHGGIEMINKNLISQALTRRMMPIVAMVAILSTSMYVAGISSITGLTTLCKGCNSSLRTMQLSPNIGGAWRRNKICVSSVIIRVC